MNFNKYRYKLSDTIRRYSASVRTLPDCLIVGAQKSGTSTLFYNLIKHPDVRRPSAKEINFFDRNYDKPLSWYRKHFPLRFDPTFQLTLEASPCYMFHPLCASRISDTLPDVKLIFLLRNPVKRAFSHYQHVRRKGAEEVGFQEALKKESSRLEGEKQKLINGETSYSFDFFNYSYLERGKYIDQINKFLEYFSENNILVLKSENFFDNPGDVLNRITEFLDLEKWSPDKLDIHNQGNYEQSIPNETICELQDVYQPYNERLRQKFGSRFDWDLKKE